MGRGCHHARVCLTRLSRSEDRAWDGRDKGIVSTTDDARLTRTDQTDVEAAKMCLSKVGSERGGGG